MMDLWLYMNKCGITILYTLDRFIDGQGLTSIKEKYMEKMLSYINSPKTEIVEDIKSN